MPFTISYQEDERIVIIENVGNIPYKDLVQQTDEALELGRIKDTRLYLADCIRLVVQADAFEVFNFFPAIYEKIGAPRNSRLAVLMSEDAVTAKDMEFYETICRNRGWQIRVFKDKGTAMEWLLG